MRDYLQIFEDMLGPDKHSGRRLTSVLVRKVNATSLTAFVPILRRTPCVGARSKQTTFLMKMPPSFLSFSVSQAYESVSEPQAVGGWPKNEKLVSWELTIISGLQSRQSQDDANCEPALQPFEVCSAPFSGQASVSYGNTTRSATSRGVHLERGDRSSLILMCVTNTRRQGSRNWSRGNNRESDVVDVQSLCSGCSIVVNLWSIARILTYRILNNEPWLWPWIWEKSYCCALPCSSYVHAHSMSEKIDHILLILTNSVSLESEPLRRNPKFRLSYALRRIPKNNIETSIRIRWSCRSLSICLWAILHKFRTPVTLIMFLNLGKNFVCRASHTDLYQHSSRSDEKNMRGRTKQHQVQFCEVISFRWWPT